jgi:hypothetical protein
MQKRPTCPPGAIFKRLRRATFIRVIPRIKSIKYWNGDFNPTRPFNYMFFTPLYGARNTGCPQISKKNYPKLEKKEKNLFRGN